MRLILAALILATTAPAAAQVTAEADGTRTLVVEDVVPAAPAAVWEEVSTAEGWKRWAVPLAWQIAPDLLETSYEAGAEPGGANNIQHRFVARIPGRLLVFRTVKSPANFPKSELLANAVAFLELIPEGGATRLRLTGTGYPGGKEGDSLLAFFEQGNRQTLAMLVERFRLAPLEWLAGHCWEGTLPTGGRNVHCFTWESGKIRDRHQVFRQDRVVYAGETLYAWDAAAGAIGFTYSSDGKQVGAGHVRAIEGGLDFGTSDYGSGEKKVTVATRWMRVGDAYDAIDSAPASPAFNHTVRYTRKD